MYKRFSFEGDIHESLECVPLTVRRKLDLAALKISLEGWQLLSRAERMALCHLPVDSELDIAIYRDILVASCQGAGVPLKRLDDPNAASRAWNVAATPEPVVVRARELGASINDDVWRSLDEETRYAVLKLTHPKRNPLKIHALLVELGLLAGPAPAIHTSVVVCEPPPPQPSAHS